MTILNAFDDIDVHKLSEESLFTGPFRIGTGGLYWSHGGIERAKQQYVELPLFPKTRTGASIEAVAVEMLRRLAEPVEGFTPPNVVRDMYGHDVRVFSYEQCSQLNCDEILVVKSDPWEVGAWVISRSTTTGDRYGLFARKPKKGTLLMYRKYVASRFEREVVL